ncbi:E4 ORF1 [simian adenovirus 55]|uniref:dUTP diphosphatase n=1 Tax=simian adenovirus 55 TaxID=2848082 RepID=A0A1L3IP01_9ADEN|nr:E4 ORF1 [Simian mastadenovirus WIV19]APG53823.1 E4 ORF1 [Simian mastadenovirus WIV19]
MATALEALLVYRLGEQGRLPEQLGTSGIYTLFSPIDFVVPPNGAAIIYLQIRIAIPDAYVGQLGSLREQVRDGVFVGAEYLDSSVTSELKVLLFNHSPYFYQGNAGDAVARLKLTRVFYPSVQEATIV